ncbi:MAG: ABC transporter ATP-binding protein [Oscillospiraceae bacterium]|nr:ABC transporter ATP-binding protein [Oscillospiraceae bacterium]
MQKLMKYIRPFWLTILFGLAIKFTATYVELQIPKLMQVVLDEKVPAGLEKEIYLFGGLMVLCSTMAMVLNITANRIAAKTAGKVTKWLRHDLFNKLQHLSPRQMDEVTVPSAVSRLTSDSYNVNNLIVRIQRIGVRAPILLVGGIFSMMTMDVPLALILVALLPFIAIVVYVVTKKSVPLHRKTHELQDKIVMISQENITGVRVVKALSKTEYEKNRFDRAVEDRNAVSLKAQKVTGISGPLTTLILNLGLTILVVAGAYRVNGGGVKPGVIVAFLQYFVMILNAAVMVTRVIIMCATAQASANRIAEVMALPEDMQCVPEEEAMENPPHIAFQNVMFSYSGKGNNLENLSFSLQKGQTLGILGATGSGKSTIIKLLLRLYDVDEGKILIDGRDVRTIPNEELRQKFGVVFQNDFVKMTSIGENVRYYRDIEENLLLSAVTDAQAADFVEEKGGLSGEVDIRGNNLSGGQKQRLLISRALAGKPEILILDDASSALDYKTDAALRRALRQNYEAATKIIVAQRVSSLRHADLILVLDDGAVIGTGNHETLMETCEEYKMIAQAQMGEREEGA